MRKGLLGRSILVVLCVVLLVGAFAVSRYPALGRLVIGELWYAPQPDARGLITMAWYWGSFLDRLRYDPEQRIYHFGPLLREMEQDPQADRLERAQLYFHQGDFDRAARDLKAVIEARGESEETLFWQALTEMRLAETVNCLDTLVHDSSQGNTALSPQVFPSGTARHGEMGHGLGKGRSSMCVVPLAAFHQQASHSEQAIAI
jgi:hypothetical protein